MEVEINNEKFIVKWNHVRESDEKPPIMTQCSIDSESRPLAFGGDAHCNPIDNYNYNTGRKMSLARALQLLFPGTGDEVKNPKTKKLYNKRTINDKKLRIPFWQAYYKMRNNKW